MKAKLLRIEAPHYVAGATWVKTDRGWRCDPKRTAPILRWMCKSTPGNVKTWLLITGYPYQWINTGREPGE